MNFKRVVRLGINRAVAAASDKAFRRSMAETLRGYVGPESEDESADDED